MGEPAILPFDWADPDFAIDESRERNRHLNFGLTLKQTFGGGNGNSSGVAQPS